MMNRSRRRRVRQAAAARSFRSPLSTLSPATGRFSGLLAASMTKTATESEYREQPSAGQPKGSYAFVSLGCPKNTVDSERMLGLLQLDGYKLVAEPDGADFVIVNTCGFIDVAKQESIDTIVEYAGIKKSGGIDKLYVTGCLSQRYKDELEVEIPEVDAYFGTLEMPALLARLEADYKHELLGERQITTLPHYAYLKISEGCNRTCSFCAIP
ncbi:MAG: hypothetical protein KDA38_15930, partial [Planctomycetales bacterium]|nr:hypothetical protein [Planctomycetales bacterium]